MAMMDAFLAWNGSIESPDERATGLDEQAPGHVFRRFDAQPQPPLPSSLLASKQEITAYGLWHKRSGVSLFVRSAIRHRP